MQQELSSLDLHFVVQELQELIGARLDTIHHLGRKDFLLVLYRQGKGKKYLRITAKMLFLTAKEPQHPSQPSALCLKLRKHLKNAFLDKITQQGGERIVELVFRSKEGIFSIFTELFSSGNLALTDASHQILAVAERARSNSRATVVGSTYNLPPQHFQTFSLTSEQFFEVLQEAKAENLVKALARDLGLGGVYAEELCILASLDKKMPPKTLTASHSSSLWEALQELLQRKLAPIVAEERALPFPLHNTKLATEYTSFNQALDTVFIVEKKVSPQLKSMQKRMVIQEEAIGSYQEAAEQATAIGNGLYEQYMSVKELLSIALAYRKSHDKTLFAQLKKHPFFVSYNSKQGTIILDIPSQ